MLFSRAFYFLLAVIFGVIFKVVWESILFYIMFSVIRSYAGGVHASKEITCMTCTSLSLLLCIAAMKLCKHLSLVAVPVVLLIFGALCILLLSPVDSAEKRLTEEEKQEYRKKSYFFMALILAAATMALICGWSELIYPCAFSLSLEGVLLLLSGK